MYLTNVCYVRYAPAIYLSWLNQKIDCYITTVSSNECIYLGICAICRGNGKANNTIIYLSTHPSILPADTVNTHTRFNECLTVQ